MSLQTLTINGRSYTAYASVAEADAYLAVDPTRCAAWSDLSETTRASHLVAATRRLDLLRWSGSKASDSQAAEWPRTGATDNGTAVDDATVPQKVEDATILLAGSIALDASTANAGTSGSNVKAVGAGSARVEFFRPSKGVTLQDETAFSLVSGLLAGAASSLFGCVSGTGGTSSFGVLGGPTRNDGFA